MKDLRLDDILTELDLLDKYAQLSGKIVVHLRADGPKKYPEKADEVWSFYENKIDDNLRHALMQYGEVYCTFDSEYYALNCIEDWFPSKTLLEDDEYDLNEEYYIYAYGVSSNGGILHN